MEALKVKLRGEVTSFRYPHFLVGNQISFKMPPPATIYGHIASALGDFPALDSFKFAYHFTYLTEAIDYEHTLILNEGNHKVNKAWGYSVNLEGKLNPTKRELLFQPQLTLYLQARDLKPFEQAFLYPEYVVVLGRSQDICSYDSVERITLSKERKVYLEHTLLPWDYRASTPLGQAVLMPKYINPHNRENVQHERYIVLRDRVFSPAVSEKVSDRQGRLLRSAPQEEFDTDPHSPEVLGARLGLVWHSFHSEEV